MSKMVGHITNKVSGSLTIIKVTCIFTIFLFALSLRASDIGTGFCFGTDLGVNLADSLKIPNAFGSTGPTIDMDPGVRCDLTAGYELKLSDQLTLEPQATAGFIYNSFTAYSTSGYYMQVPLLANGLLNWQFKPDWKAYAGAGIGGGYNRLSKHVIRGYGLGDNVDGEFDFAWQVLIGIKHQFSFGELGLGYSYLASRAFGWGMNGNHSILVSYTVRF